MPLARGRMGRRGLIGGPSHERRPSSERPQWSAIGTTGARIAATTAAIDARTAETIADSSGRRPRRASGFPVSPLAGVRR